MNQEKGFTLVELLAVIVILAIVLIIAVPGVLTIINKTKTSTYDRQIDMIKEATRTYVTTNDNVKWHANQTVVNVSDLQGQGLLDQKLLDPRDKTEIKSLAVVVTRNGNKMKYDIVYTDDSNASYPVFSNNMIPIRYDGTNWVKADAKNEDHNWFDYTNQQWANVATVTEDVRQTLVDASPGTIVPMDKINAMFVWIPRFKYKLFNVDGSVGPIGNTNLVADYTIQIDMESKEAKKSTGSQNGEWLTHPAFTFGDQELDGFWMAKFETGYAGATTTTEAQSNTLDPFKITVKPNVYSWRWLQLNNMYHNAKGMSDAGNPYGLTTSEDPHMVKNIEWGAMTYLTYSQYGKAGNPSYSGNEKEVRMNNNNTYVTGCGAEVQEPVLSSTCEAYDTANGQAASTTGNITGIYDTSGGAWDYVAAVIKTINGTDLYVAYSGFDQPELNQIGKEGKYLDVYEYGTEMDDRARGHLGDATLEMGPFDDAYSSWYRDYGVFIRDTNPWMLRGTAAHKNYPTYSAGPTSYSSSAGGNSIADGYRIILV